MTPQTLIDVPAANADARESQRRVVSQRWAEYCGAKSVAAFLLAVEQYQQDIEQIERRGWCLACGGPLVAETVCAKCGRDNS
jgi:hypothetical protein